MDSRFIIESFWQSANNCASIVLIKAAIIRYGTGGVFKVSAKGEYFIVELKDGTIIALDNNDISRINRGNKIRFSPYRDPVKKKAIHRLKDYTRLCFAIIVRMLQLKGYDGREFTETSAINELTKEGVRTDYIHTLLGLQRKTSKAKKLTKAGMYSLKKSKAALLYSDHHIVVASEGFYDDYGVARELTEEIPVLKGNKAKFWYQLK